MSQIRVAVVDDHPIFRAAVVHMCNLHDDIDIVGQGDCAESVSRIAKDKCPDVMVIGLNLPGTSFSALAAINSAHPIVKVLFLSTITDEKHVCHAVLSGAHGYVLKEADGDEVVRAVRAIYGGETYVTPSLAGHLLTQLAQKATHLWSLSDREEQILALVEQGLSNREIGSKLHLTEGTVKGYMAALFQKLEIHNRTGAALVAKRRSGRA